MTSVRTLLDRTLSRLALVGADPSDDEDTRLRKGLLVLIVVLILPISLAWCALYVTSFWDGSGSSTTSGATR